ncbi:uncharacterized protein LAESUDRAFT_155709 [Laetiporus sulphureus 93-53]|uniref:Uncharacterized protein n=1 Tax=Laetiporus sulphureus 93-53 TaxID=1314785 RepID=A0A165HKW6_9APHY|nr:uncharacterized protein LAESUDRAFT_155709 [Laetiporus sulphureus 93-53]KZT11863.1 hypothetical protein LAESUDRAFT_155709 [Laetiporus sulphureus 93-53]
MWRSRMINSRMAHLCGIPPLTSYVRGSSPPGCEKAVVFPIDPVFNITSTAKLHQRTYICKWHGREGIRTRTFARAASGIPRCGQHDESTDHFLCLAEHVMMSGYQTQP